MQQVVSSFRVGMAEENSDQKLLAALGDEPLMGYAELIDKVIYRL